MGEETPATTPVRDPAPSPAPLSAEKQLAVDRSRESRERRSLVLWRQPIKTTKYFMLETWQLLLSLGSRLLDHRLVGAILMLGVLYNLPGPHEHYMQSCQRNVGFLIYWMGLGVLSSIGFGSGLHTFLLYLGPHIASVTLAATECQSLEFPAPPYPDEKICPAEPYKRQAASVWNILWKVRLEALLWGVGTALGELPPYFMARATRLSGNADTEEGELPLPQKRRCSNLNLKLCELMTRFMERLVMSSGFLGILICASVPNPLFDLAGVTCGHFLVPFWKFFGATLIGKALIKSHIQQIIVIVAFNEHLIEGLLQLLAKLPLLQVPLKSLLASTKERMHGKVKSGSSSNFDLIARGFELCAFVMVAYFIVSLVNSLAQRHCKRLQKQQRELLNIAIVREEQLLEATDEANTEAEQINEVEIHH